MIPTYEISKTGKPIETESRLMVAREAGQKANEESAY